MKTNQQITSLNEEARLTKGERTAQRILDSAEKCFAQYGYTGTSLRQVAAEVGIKEPGLYRHFANKEALYRQMLERALRPIADTMEVLLDEQVGIDGLQFLPEKMFILLGQSPQVAVLLQQAVAHSRSMQQQDSFIAAWLAELISQGRRLFIHSSGKEVDDADVVLKIINLFNLCTGFYASAALMMELLPEDVSTDDLMQRQRQILGRMAAAL
ncbi:hypothetical protein SIN8267_02112 [Sinobacterium norvegicum]|uniref:HTH tetR-type domain-containing protein n=1 Tax=Sinobacterium norvegicum TaxID=1641715 RepID=A0ABM9AFM3_9GAMM|nr:TetR/AcrR family transcriptional regulator [Sinobacterium norvegicum]CAH0991997.1 hypothetical protein SIN8267_02112 [Sinobacterium norvegicum]